MKKIVLATLLALAGIASAQAVEVGVVGGTDFLNDGPNRGTFGLTVGQHFGDFSATVEGLRETHGDTNKFNLLGGYNFAKIGTATFTVKAGVAYLDNSKINSSDRYAGVVGLGTSIPVTSKVSATVDYRYQATNDTAKSFQGNTVLVGAKYAF